MIPCCMWLDVGGRVRLFFPVILVWIVVVALLIVSLPFVVIAGLATLRGGPGFRLLVLYPAFFRVLFALSGFRVDIASRRNGRVFISFA
jgi:hypothetical protein